MMVLKLVTAVTTFFIVSVSYGIAPSDNGSNLHLMSPVQDQMTGGYYRVAMNNSNNLQKEELIFSVNAVMQDYVLYSPASYQSSRQYPLLVVAPGSDVKLQRFIRSTGITELAEQNKFLVAVLNSESSESWGSMLNAKDNSGSAQYIRALIEHVASNKNVQRNRIYLAGFSLGGMLVLSSMCELQDTIAGFAVVAASLPRQLMSNCNIRKKISIPTIMIASRDDPVIPWEGGTLRNEFGKLTNLQLLSVHETSEIWRQANGCDARPLIEPLANEDVSDGTTVTRLSYDFNCNGNGVVFVYAITGAGHTWPGSRYKLPAYVGTISQDLDATRLIWEFFTRGNKGQ